MVVSSDCQRTYARSLVRKRVLMGTTTAPILARAKNVYSHSGRLGIQRATRSPGCIPRCSKALAVQSTSVRSWAKLQRWLSKVSTSLALQRAAASSNKAPKVFFSYQSCMSCLPVLWLPGPVAAYGVTVLRGASRDGALNTREESTGLQPCLASTPCLHTSSAGANGGRISPGAVLDTFPLDKPANRRDNGQKPNCRLRQCAAVKRRSIQ